MSVTDISKDTDNLTMTVTAEYDVTADRAWQLFADPRQLERWWGPPTYPATIEEHDLTPGGRVSYYMTGPEGDKPHGWWKILSAEPPRLLELEDGFADDAGTPNPDLPTAVMRVEISDRPGGVTMTIRTQFPSAEAMEQVLAMGMEEGIRQAAGQIDAVLADARVS
jgi:uncharacterized protein YndB with AHSA1/START domain